MIIELLEEKKDFTHAEGIISDYIRQNASNIYKLSADELGKVTYTSRATVFHLCKKLGYKSYKEFIHQIESEYNQRKQINELIEKEPFQKNMRLNEIMETMPELYDTIIKKTNLILNQNVFNRVVSRINNAFHVDIYSTGITSSCAMSAMFKLMSIDKPCNVHDTINEHYLMEVKDKNIVAIILSFTGSNPNMIHVAQYLTKCGIYIIGIGGDESSAIKNLCDEYINIYEENLVLSFEVSTPYLSMTYIFDLIFASLLTRHFDEHVKHAAEVIQFNDK
ncbi:MAG: MurR/RpiR family transcriptional regulator [Erysipelotrichaceae bacterium]|nr:MurR/RpiR family transcriptional regulator [Erysipelotrichaceae bacterium]